MSDSDFPRDPSPGPPALTAGASVSRFRAVMAIAADWQFGTTCTISNLKLESASLQLEELEAQPELPPAAPVPRPRSGRLTRANTSVVAWDLKFRVPVLVLINHSIF